MKINEAKETMSRWHGIPKSRILAKRFTEKTRDGIVRHVLVIAPCRDGLKIERFADDGFMYGIGSLFRDIEDPQTCFERFDNYLSGTL